MGGIKKVNDNKLNVLIFLLEVYIQLMKINYLNKLTINYFRNYTTTSVTTTKKYRCYYSVIKSAIYPVVAFCVLPQ
jgi:hypothetical protein